jgi:RNA polymerase sigma factor (TIGR02999 family)
VHPSDDVTLWLQEASRGDRRRVDDLFPVLYEELRRLAGSHLARERSDHTLQATALVNEAYLRLVDQTRVDWKSRAHFMAVASQAIRRILIDHARGRARDRRGGGAVKLPLEAAFAVADGASNAALVDLDRALEKLAAAYPEKARLVTLRYFGGLTVDEIAQVENAGTPRPRRRRRERRVLRRTRRRRLWGSGGAPCPRKGEVPDAGLRG